MREEIRRAIAVNAAVRINKRAPSSIYSYDRGRRSSITPNYDYEAGAHIGDSGTKLYHYGVGTHISLSISGNSFSGYDYDRGHHFNGRVNGNSIQIYDYGESSYFTYSV